MQSHESDSVWETGMYDSELRLSLAVWSLLCLNNGITPWRSGQNRLMTHFLVSPPSWVMHGCIPVANVQKTVCREDRKQWRNAKRETLGQRTLKSCVPVLQLFCKCDITSKPQKATKNNYPNKITHTLFISVSIYLLEVRWYLSRQVSQPLSFS